MSGIKTEWYRTAPDEWREPLRWAAQQPSDEHRQLHAQAAERIRQTGYPQAESFAEHSVLKPRSEKDTLEAFARAELK